jgi:PAS domain-containing protein
MAQKPIELILMRQLASSLVMPIFLVDMAGTLLFYNEPAEQILGMRFDETGEMPASEWTTRWEPSDADGAPLVPERLPLMVAVQECRPAHGELWIRGGEGRRRHIQVTAIPLVAAPDRQLGAAAIFWEEPA